MQFAISSILGFDSTMLNDFPEIEDGFIKNVIFIVIQEANENDKCDIFKSNLKNHLRFWLNYIFRKEYQNYEGQIFYIYQNHFQMEKIFHQLGHTPQ
jgi:hypothetical protein